MPEDQQSEATVPLLMHLEALIEAQRDRFEEIAKSLRGSITDIERNLREHILQQIVQIKDALDARERLDAARHATDIERIEALKREVEIQRLAGAQAIAKAEAANEKRFEAFDEIREQVASQAGEFLRRDVAEAQYDELRRSVNSLADEYRRAIADINQRLGKIT